MSSLLREGFKPSAVVHLLIDDTSHTVRKIKRYALDALVLKLETWSFNGMTG
jgi:hypothetical protein